MQPLAIRKDRYRCQRLRSIRRDRNSGRNNGRISRNLQQILESGFAHQTMRSLQHRLHQSAVGGGRDHSRLIIVEGEKDVLVLMEAGYRHVISVPSGAASDLAKSFEAFTSWLDQVQDIVICGDTDLPGRTLVKHLSDYFEHAAFSPPCPEDAKT